MTLDRTFRWTPRCRRHGVSHLFSPGLALYLACSFCTLHRQVTDLLLFELFSQVGPVERVTIPLAENGGTEAWRDGGINRIISLRTLAGTCSRRGRTSWLKADTTAEPSPWASKRIPATSQNTLIASVCSSRGRIRAPFRLRSHTKESSGSIVPFQLSLA